MGIFKDLVGQRFGKLTVTRYLGNSKWECLCDCGNTTITTTGKLNNGEKSNCGCSRSLVGKIYGDLKVAEYLGNKKYICRCINCGAECEQYSSNLKGNLKCQNCSNKHKDDLTSKIFGMLTVEHYNSVTKKWICKCTCEKMIEVRAGNLKSGNTASCGHCKYVESAQKDCIAGTRLSSLNAKLSKANNSGYKGVYYIGKRHRWRAEICFQGKRYYLGYFEKMEDAVSARKKAENRLHGDFLEWYENWKNGGNK